MFIMSPSLKIMKHCVLLGLLALAVSACALLQTRSADSGMIQVNPDRVQVVSDALEARLQLMILQAHPTPGG